MRVDVPAWPPVASRSTSSVRSPSEAPYTAAARPVGPAADDHEVVGVVPRLDLQADRRPRARDWVGLVRMRPSAAARRSSLPPPRSPPADRAVRPPTRRRGRPTRSAPGCARGSRAGRGSRDRCARPITIGMCSSPAACVSRPSTRTWISAFEPLLERARLAHELAELRAVEARDAQRRRRPGAGEERRAEHDRQLAEQIARLIAHRDAGASPSG